LRLRSSSISILQFNVELLKLRLEVMRLIDEPHNYSFEDIFVTKYLKKPMFMTFLIPSSTSKKHNFAPQNF
jgi:hypothetical protein